MALIMDTADAHHGLWNVDGIDLPNGVSLCIVALLSVRDVCSLGSCNRNLRVLCSSNLTWSTLYKRRWRTRNAAAQKSTLEGRSISEVKDDPLRIPNDAGSKGWRPVYIYMHKHMANGATSVIELVKARACYDSLEASDYQKAMALLCSIGLEFQDVFAGPKAVCW